MTILTLIPEAMSPEFSLGYLIELTTNYWEAMGVTFILRNSLEVLRSTISNS